MLLETMQCYSGMDIQRLDIIPETCTKFVTSFRENNAVQQNHEVIQHCKGSVRKLLQLSGMKITKAYITFRTYHINLPHCARFQAGCLANLACRPCFTAVKDGDSYPVGGGGRGNGNLTLTHTLRVRMAKHCVSRAGDSCYC